MEEKSQIEKHFKQAEEMIELMRLEIKEISNISTQLSKLNPMYLVDQIVKYKLKIEQYESHHMILSTVQSLKEYIDLNYGTKRSRKYLRLTVLSSRDVIREVRLMDLSNKTIHIKKMAYCLGKDKNNGNKAMTIQEFDNWRRENLSGIILS